MVWDPKAPFEGNLIEFLFELFNRFYPSLHDLRQAQIWIEREIQRDGPFPVRHFRSSIIEPTFGAHPKVNIFDVPGSSRRVIASDNEVNSSFFAQTLQGWSPEKFSQSLLGMMQNQTITIGIFRKPQTTESSKSQFDDLGIRGGMNKHSMRVACANLKLCHISDAARLGDFGHLRLDNIDEEIIIRFYRLISPLNVFPFPNPNHFLGEISNISAGREFGESEEGKRLFAEIIRKGIRDEDLFNSWFEYSQPPFELQDLKRTLDQFRNATIRLTPKPRTST